MKEQIQYKHLVYKHICCHCVKIKKVGVETAIWGEFLVRLSCLVKRNQWSVNWFRMEGKENSPGKKNKKLALVIKLNYIKSSFLVVLLCTNLLTTEAERKKSLVSIRSWPYKVYLLFPFICLKVDKWQECKPYYWYYFRGSWVALAFMRLQFSWTLLQTSIWF